MTALRAGSPTTTHRLSDETIDRAAAVLDAYGIGHGPLFEGQPNLNLNLSDATHVFCKVSRVDDLDVQRPAIELQAARFAADAGLPVPLAMHPSPLEFVDEMGARRLMTVWEHVDACTAPALRDRCIDLVDLIHRVGTVEVPVAPTLDIDFFVARAHRRLAGRDDTLSVDIVARVEDAARRAKERLEPASFVWLHGDTHLRNVLWGANGRPMLLDWESACRGPVEFDIAAALKSVFVFTIGYAPSERIASSQMLAREAEDRFEPDWDLVRAFVDLRRASAESHLHLIGHDPDQLRLSLELGSLLELSVDEPWMR